MGLHTFSDTTLFTRKSNSVNTNPGRISNYYTLCIKQTKFRLAYNIIHILLLNPNVVMANSYLLEK